MAGMDPGSRYYHNPRCSKSREGLALLADRGVSPQTIEYLEQPPSVDELRDLLVMLAMPARDLMRTGETVYKDLGLADPSLSEDELLEAMHDNPILIERPIFVHGGRAVVGRPADNVLQLLD